MKKKPNPTINKEDCKYITIPTIDRYEYYIKKEIPLVDCIHTYQGEGPNVGKKMVLCRYKYCNLMCSFCDTQKTTCNIKPVKYSLKDIDIMLMKSPNLMITGGEPTLDIQYNDTNLSQFDCTVKMISNLNYKFVDIETNGYKIVDLIDEINLLSSAKLLEKDINISWSPKFIKFEDYYNNLDKLDKIIYTINENKRNCRNYKKLPSLKVVIGQDMNSYKMFVYDAVTKYGYDPNSIYLMPKGTTINEINSSMKDVMEIASELSCNVSSRLHILHNFA